MDPAEQLDGLIRLVCRSYGYPYPIREYVPIEGRRFRCDWAWPDLLLAIEYEGGTWMGSRHTLGSGFRRDVEKYNLLALAGWTVLRVTADMLRDGSCVPLIQQALAGRCTNAVDTT